MSKITKKMALETAEKIRYGFEPADQYPNGNLWSNIIIQYILDQPGENPMSYFCHEPTPVVAHLPKEYE